jgi:putative transcriptional regulator
MSRSLPVLLLCLLLPLFVSPAHAGEGASLRGHLLIATHQEDHTPFQRTVILVLRHGPSGAYGVVVNRPTHLTLKDVLPQRVQPKRQNLDVYAGGPVGLRQLSVLVRGHFAGKGIDQVMPHVAYTTRASAFHKLVGEAPDPKKTRVLMGYAGWGPNQLESEIARGAWQVEKASADKIFTGDPAKTWRRLHHGTGEAAPEGVPLHAI